MEEFEELRRQHEEHEAQLKLQEIEICKQHITHLINGCTEMPIQIPPYSADHRLMALRDHLDDNGSNRLTCGSRRMSTRL